MLILVPLAALVVLALLTDGAVLVPLWHLAVWCWSLHPVAVSGLALAWLLGTVAVFTSGRRPHRRAGRRADGPLADVVVPLSRRSGEVDEGAAQEVAA